MMETFDKHGVSFVSVTQQFNTASSMGRLVLNVLLSFAQFEREMISERTRDKIAAARRKGKWVGGMPLLGYNVVDSKLVVDPDEAEQVRQIFALYLQQDGLIPVVQELNRRDWRTKKWTTKRASSRGGQPFTKNRLWRLLTNVAYIGKLRYKDEIHDAEHQPIVSQDTWQKTQAKLARQGRTGGREVRNKFGAILKGLIHCTACGCAMSPSHSTQEGRRYRYYVCQNAQKRGWNECLAPSLPAGEVERFVVEQIKCIGRDPAIVAETVRQVRRQAAERIEELETEERRLVRELAGYQRELRRMTANPNASPGAVAAGASALESQSTDSERRLTEVRDETSRLRRDLIDEADVAHALAEFDPVWQSLSPREQGRLLQLLVARVEHDARDGTLAIEFHPSGIKALANGEFAGDVA
jgi:site-specific DNA recombinase